jgi:radical SAM-linked protein
MHKLLVKFSKFEDMKFISHLDLMRLFERALRRAHIPISYTQGFNPHPRLSFAAPLALGAESFGDYLEMEVDERINAKNFVDDLNSVLPRGIQILDAKYINPQSKALMALVDWSQYEVMVKNLQPITQQQLKAAVEDILTSRSVEVIKESKDKLDKKVDIRPGIDFIKPAVQDNNIILDMVIASGSRLNIRPELVVNAILSRLGIKTDNAIIRVKRIEIFLQDKDTKIPLSNWS